MNFRASCVRGFAKNSDAGPFSIRRPRCSSTTSPASRLACAEIVRGHHHLDAARGDGAHDVLDRLGGGGIEAGGRLVEKQHFGIARQRARQRQPLLFAARQPPRRTAVRVRRGRPARAIRRCGWRAGRAARPPRPARSGHYRRRCGGAWSGAGTGWRGGPAARRRGRPR